MPNAGALYKYMCLKLSTMAYIAALFISLSYSTKLFQIILTSKIYAMDTSKSPYIIELY